MTMRPKLPKRALIDVPKIRRVTSPTLPKRVLIDVPKTRLCGLW